MKRRSQELLERGNKLPRAIGRANDLSVSATNQYVVLEGEKGLCVVDLFRDSDNVKVIPKGKQEPGKIEFNPHVSHSNMVASSSGTSLVLWDISVEKVLLAMHPAHTRAMTGLSWSRHNPTLLASSSLDATIKVWDVRVPKNAKSNAFKSFISAQSSVSWSPHSSHLLASSHGGEVKLWDIRVPDKVSDMQYKQVDRFVAYMADICALNWAKAEDNVLLTCTKDKPAKSQVSAGHAEIWNTEKFPSELLYNVPMNLPIQSALFFPHSSHHILTSHISHNSLYVWDTESSKSFEPLFSLPMGDEPIVAFDFQVLGQSHNDSGDNICVISVTKELSLRKFPIPFDFATALVESPPPPRSETSRLDEDDFVPLDLALEFARAVQMPIPGIKILESNSGRRTISVSFSSAKLGEFKLRISFPTMYPRGASPSFEFMAPQTHETERIELLRCLTEVAGAKVAKNKLCLIPCLEAISQWTATNIGDIIDPHPPTPNSLGGNATANITSPALPLPSITAFTINQTTKSRARARSLPPAMDGPFVVVEQQKRKTQASIPPLDDSQHNPPLKLYTVSPTDTLMGIAIAYKMHPTVLKKLNRLYSNQIIPGQQLWVHKYPDPEPHAPPLSSTHSESIISSPSPTLPTTTPLSPPTSTTTSTTSISSSASTSSPSIMLPSALLSPTTSLDSKNKFSTKRLSLTKSEILKQEMIYWSPTFCVSGTLTITPHMMIFEPSIEDPLVIQGGILQFQLCIDLSQVCSVKLYRSQSEFKHMLKNIKRENDQANNSVSDNFVLVEAKDLNKNEENNKKDSSAPTIYPCMEIVVLHSRRMQTVYLGHMQLDKIEPLYNQVKQRAMESRMQATQNGQTIPPIADNLARSPMRDSQTQEQLASIAISPTPSHAGANASATTTSTNANANASAGASTQENTLRMSVGSPLPAYLRNTQILDAVGVKHLRSCLPARFHGVDWELLYSTTMDGISINTFYRHMRNAAPSLLLIEDANGHVFGAYLSEPWQPDSQGRYYGTGESFLFTLHPTFNVYRWTRQNDFFMTSCPHYIAVGGSDKGYGLYLDEDFDNGTSTPSTTFNSPTLSSTSEFKCSVMEAWGFL